MTLSKIIRPSKYSDLKRRSAIVMLTSAFEFLRHNGVSEDLILAIARRRTSKRYRATSNLYGDLLTAYEEMGIIMATWFSNPKFLTDDGGPRTLSEGNGPCSISSLIRASKAQVNVSVAMSLMKQSSSVRISSKGQITALRRVFWVPELEIPRAAFVIERYLQTLQRNSSNRKEDKTLLLERSAHVSEVDLGAIAPLIRDIESRGTAFINSIDGEIEQRRVRRRGQNKNLGELGVLVFAWTGSKGKIRRASNPTNKTSAPSNSKSR